MIRALDPDVLILSETKIDKTQAPTISGYNTHAIQRATEKSQGMLVLTKKRKEIVWQVQEKKTRGLSG